MQFMNKGNFMKRTFLIIALFLFAFSFIGKAHSEDCIFDPSKNEMAKDWNEVNSSQTIQIENQWFYTASGTVNASFTLAQDENYFEVKMLSNRHLIPYYKKLKQGTKFVYYYGPDWYGLETKIVRVHCPSTASSALGLDPYSGLAVCCGKEDSFYKPLGSSTILVIKKGRLRVKEVK